MKNTEQLEHALKALREADAPLEPPAFLDTRLTAAFREQHKPKEPVWGWLSAAVAAACLIGVIGWTAAAPLRVRVSQPPAIAKAPAAPEIGFVKPVRAVPQPMAVATRRAAKRPRPQFDETERFVALPYAPPFTPHDRGQVVRIGVPRSTLRQLGFPVNAERMFERVPADVFVGEDGFARAVRVVSH